MAELTTVFTQKTKLIHIKDFMELLGITSPEVITSIRLVRIPGMIEFNIDDWIEIDTYTPGKLT